MVGATDLYTNYNFVLWTSTEQCYPQTNSTELAPPEMRESLRGLDDWIRWSNLLRPTVGGPGTTSVSVQPKTKRGAVEDGAVWTALS